ncbi:TIGR00645 family protein [Methanosphaera sp. BMS]|uniref:TIGR00645 family protein n=1 Tax=Methanosphaera sp. BMS TaxID=1789762 RepID=UPI000DC1E943|nr:TIGR00645 family protein [Methanosphaera sp. BMS]AWX31712.1 hypothetical protein AW729_00800 [Methanosphaera sp. BMS]
MVDESVMTDEQLDKENTSKYKLEYLFEKIIFSSRWFLAPIFLGLVIALLILAVKFILLFVTMIPNFITMSFEDFAMYILSLLDLALLGCLVLLVTLSGYENFVSKLDPAEMSDDRPSWLGKLDFSGLKLKIVSSIVAISLVELLRDFFELGSGIDPTFEMWRIALHLVFVISGVLLSWMVYIGEKKGSKKDKLDSTENPIRYEYY